jgi:DNA-binding PadR family transcriptional regulator
VRSARTHGASTPQEPRLRRRSRETFACRVAAKAHGRPTILHSQLTTAGALERYIVDISSRPDQGPGFREVIMSDSYGGGFGSGSSNWGKGGPGPGQGLWEAMEQLRGMFEQKVAPRMGKGDVRTAVLALLAEKPMHGYQIISEISERSGGAWKPSAGSVYPTLQLLADEGLITAEEEGGRKTYTLTEMGRAEAATSADRAPWPTGSTTSGGGGGRRDFGHAGPIAKSGMELAQAAAQVGRTGTPEQVEQAVEILDEARRRLYSILAQD